MSSQSNKQALGLAASAICALAFGYGALMPPSEIPGPPSNDKLLHFLAFFAIVFPSALLAPQRAMKVALSALVYGAIIEVIQPYFGRGAEVADMLANTGGILMALVLGRFATGRFARR